MELRANCKINLGLRVLRRRADGFHDIETVMLPVRGLYDELSVTIFESVGSLHHTTRGAHSAPSASHPAPLAEDNLCMRALRLVQREFGDRMGGRKAHINDIQAHITLRKNIPMGAGLGGGSSDAAFTLRALDQEFALGLTDSALERLGAELGSDVPFFVRNTPQLCTGRGEIMTPVNVDLSGKWLAILKPDAAVSTAEAYAGIVPRESGLTGAEIAQTALGVPKTATETPDAGLSLAEIVRRDVGQWRELLVNDFEISVFARHPEIGALKRTLYDTGAIYASMSGSGSAVFGIFADDPKSRLESLQDPIFRHFERFHG